MSGPNVICSTENLTTWDANDFTKIILSKEGPSIPPKSLVTAVNEACDKGGQRMAFAQKVDGKWMEWTFREYYNDIMNVSRAFIKLGLEERHSVCISGFNSPEWFLSQMGAIFVGGIAAGLYPTNKAATNRFILEDSRANILVAEEEKTVKDILPHWKDIPHLKKIIIWGDKVSDDLYSKDVLRWEDVMKLGQEMNNFPVLERQKNMAINQCCILIYTSGTTGNPKGVMLSHDSIYWEAMTLIDFFQAKNEVVVSYLPLSHIGGQMQDIWIGLLSLSTVVFADKNALKGTLVETLKETRPTIFFAVPRVYEKMMEGIKDIGRKTTGVKRMLADSCKKAGVEYHLDSTDGMMYAIGKKTIYPKVLQALGLDRSRGFWSGAAPIGVDTLKFFLGLNVIIHDVYGMSEVAGIQTAMSGDKPRMGSVGPKLSGTEIKLINVDSEGNGEICMRGRNRMMGYLNRKDKTIEDVDSEGWVHSGDLGSIDDEGHLYINGRIKELLITSGGENIAPTPIENAIKEALPCLSNVVLIGDKQKFLSCFLSFNVIIDKENNQMPTDDLTPATVSWCQSVGSNATKVSEILGKPDMNVMKAVQDGIDMANKRSVSRAALVQKWMILPLDLSIPTGELGPTLKLKRFEFNKKYEDAINTLYKI